MGHIKVDENQVEIWRSICSSFIQLENEPFHSANNIFMKYQKDYVKKLVEETASELAMTVMAI